MSMTMAERILARASGRTSVVPGEFITAKIDRFLCHESFAAVYNDLKKCGFDRINDPEKLTVVLDHYIPAPTVRISGIHKHVRAAVRELGIKHFYDTNAGVCHQVMVEKGHVLPGELVVCTDSHTTMYGALGAASCGIGFSEMTYALCTGSLWFRVPETVRFILKGKLSPMVCSKDIILMIAGKYSSSIALYKSVEFDGPLVSGLSIDSRFTMSNMSVELGAKFGFFETDEITRQYLHERTASRWEDVTYDKQACFSEKYEIDVTGLKPQVAQPHSVDNVAPAEELGHIKIDQAVLGSCTNGRMEDLRAAAEILKGRSVHPSVRLYVVPASMDVYKEAIRAGILDIFVSSGAVVLNPGCGPCFGAHMGLLAPGERCISSTNRNFRGRMGSSEAEVYLASPVTVAASSITGHITDPRSV
jgi:3-isopropylmalate/(R)-2-methylmalate dehydratase large subunit